MPRQNVTLDLVDRIVDSGRRRPKKPKYPTLHVWMEAKRVNATKLMAMLREQRNVSISPGHMSNLMKGARRISLPLAVEIWEVTDREIPLRSLLEWPVKEAHSSRSVA